MTIGYTTIQFGNQFLYLTNISKKRVPGIIKQKSGGTIVKHTIPGRTTREWEITSNGVIYDTSTAATTSRIALENMDSLVQYDYNDGMIHASMMIDSPDGLTWDDNQDNPLHYTYSIKLIEFNQSD